VTGRFLGIAVDNDSGSMFHNLFARQAGSEQIASPFALAVLAGLFWRFLPPKALEVGAGIGTMTALLCWRGVEIDYVEDSVWCRERLRAMLPYRGIQELRTASLVPTYPLAVIDGDQLPAGQVVPMLLRGAWIFVEGNRRRWRADLAHYCRITRRGVAAVHLRPFDRSKGVWLIQLDPTVGWRLRFALERGWQAVLTGASRAWSWLTGSTYYRGKRRQVPA